MTIHAVWFAYCDSDRDDCPTGRDAACENERSRADLLADLKQWGWKLGRKKTICPSCVAAIESESTGDSTK